MGEMVFGLCYPVQGNGDNKREYSYHSVRHECEVGVAVHLKVGKDWFVVGPQVARHQIVC
jgi:hypothetical protein